MRTYLHTYRHNRANSYMCVLMNNFKSYCIFAEIAYQLKFGMILLSIKDYLQLKLIKM